MPSSSPHFTASLTTTTGALHFSKILPRELPYHHPIFRQALINLVDESNTRSRWIADGSNELSLSSSRLMANLMRYAVATLCVTIWLSGAPVLLGAQGKRRAELSHPIFSPPLPDICWEQSIVYG
ncbi:hypothetical protein AN958_00721 [Leucoagaricus sp. SymC.cos]|nr:hypothetical protein AN958_00721 [Leucoagaricus sp. SymC.cos]